MGASQQILLALAASGGGGSPPTFHDTAFGTNDTAGTSLGTADQIAVTAGDLILVACRWEQATGAIASISDGVDTYTEATALQDHALPMHMRTFYTVATTTGNRTVTFSLDVSRSWRRVSAISFTPGAGGTGWTLGNVFQTSGFTSGTDPFSFGPLTEPSTGIVMNWMSIGGNRTLTPGSGWTAPAELNGVMMTGEYRIAAGGSVSGTGNFNAGVEYLGSLVGFNQT